MSKLKRKNPYGEYKGNIFGWKFSLMGLVFIIFIGGLAIYRHVTLGVPFNMEEMAKEPAKDSIEIEQDTLKAPLGRE